MSNIGPVVGIATPALIGGPGGPGFSPPLIGTTAPSVYADFTASHYYAAGQVQPTLAAFMTAAGGTYTNANGKYVTNGSGQLTAVAANTVPFDYRWNGTVFAAAGVLLEGASTNLITESNNLSGDWNQDGNTIAQGIVDPTGGVAGWTATDTSAGTHARQWAGIAVAATTSYTFSIYAKAGTLGFASVALQDVAGNIFGANFNLATGAFTTQVVTGTPTGTSAAAMTLSNGWYRCSVTLTNATAGTAYMIWGLSNSATPTWNAGGYINYTGTGTGTVEFFGAQMEALPFATSYIPTTAGTVTRPADSFTLAPAGGFAITAETLFGQCTDYAAANTGTIGLVALNNAAATNRINLLLGTGTTGEALASSGGTSEFTLAPANAVAGGLNKCGVSASVASGGIAVINAGTAATGTMAAMPTALTTMDIGFTDATPANSLFGDVAKVGAWPVAATAAQLQALTT